MEQSSKSNENMQTRYSENVKLSETSPVNQTRSATISSKIEIKSPSSIKKASHQNLLELIRVNPKAKLWQCILTSIVSISKMIKKEEKKETVKEMFDDNVIFLKQCKQKQSLKMQQIVFDQNLKEKESIVQIKSISNPLRRLDSREQKHKLFIERSLKKENKIDFSMDIKITEYGYELFSLLKNLNKISIEDIKNSFDIEHNFELNISNTSELFGRSGATFFFTRDNKYVLKSISQGNALTFIHNFPKFFTYILANNENSLMVRIFGLYKIKVKGFENTYFILMENLMENLVDHLILRLYDLKGSKFQRNQDNFKTDLQDQNQILKSIFGENLNSNLQNISDDFLTDQIMIVRGKDCDFIESSDVFITLKKEDKIEFISTLEDDVKFFIECNLMDYSLIFIKALKNPFIEKDKFTELEKQEPIQINNENFENNVNSQNPTKKIQINNENSQINEYKQVTNNKENNRTIHSHNYRKYRNYESPDGKYIYSLAIVDFLQSYHFLKIMETQIKSIFQEKPHEISCVDPHYYGERFLKFIISVIHSDSF